MRNPLLSLLTAGMATSSALCPDLPEEAEGPPAVGSAPCEGPECHACADVCPTDAIEVSKDAEGGIVALDRGRCIGCSACIRACPTGTIFADRSTRTATRRREALVMTNRRSDDAEPRRSGVRDQPRERLFHRSLHIREVSTGCSATDQEVAATTNPVFDVGRFGVHFVASPRFADALIVTGPVGRAMQEPLRRCYEAMAEPRIVIAVGTCAISGGLFRRSYAESDGVGAILPVDVYVPGCPPHPWSIVHGILLAMGRERDAER
jgi:Ni,Fe-hydrogenase III small subunit/ferredoxin